MIDGRLSRQERRRLARERVKRHAEQPYVGKMLSAALADPGLAPRGTVTVCRVLHDDRCPALAGGLCRCDPEIEWGREP
jgi:hypothetical protein